MTLEVEKTHAEKLFDDQQIIDTLQNINSQRLNEIKLLKQIMSNRQDTYLKETNQLKQQIADKDRTINEVASEILQLQIAKQKSLRIVVILAIALNSILIISLMCLK